MTLGFLAHTSAQRHLLLPRAFITKFRNECSHPNLYVVRLDRFISTELTVPNEDKNLVKDLLASGDASQVTSVLLLLALLLAPVPTPHGNPRVPFIDSSSHTCNGLSRHALENTRSGFCFLCLKDFD